MLGSLRGGVLFINAFIEVMRLHVGRCSFPAVAGAMPAEAAAVKATSGPSPQVLSHFPAGAQPLPGLFVCPLHFSIELHRLHMDSQH